MHNIIISVIYTASLMSTTISTANTMMSGIIKSSVIPTATSIVTHITPITSVTPSVTPSVTSVTTVIIFYCVYDINKCFK